MKSITIIGGGIAGLATGIALRQRSIPVTVLEAHRYPRHKVCGEFLNGTGLPLLEQLELKPGCLGIPVESISFHHRARSSAPSPLPKSGLAIARFSFDQALADKFLELGGDLRCDTRFEGSMAQEGFVRASGRKLRRSAKWKWYGLKAHASNVQMTADLELHMVPNGYIGLCRLSRDRVNVCGLFRRRTAVHDRNLAPIEHFTTAPSLRERLRHAEWHEDSLVAVSALPLREQIRHGDALSVGDAFSMIPPFTGNGMSVAIESGFVAAESLVRYARKECSWPDAIRQFQSAGGKLFKRRFTLANFAQGLLNNALCQQLFVRTADHSWLWRRVFELTR